MNGNVVLYDPKTIFQNLLEETIQEYAGIRGKQQGDIIVGASESVFSFRNNGGGIIAGRIASGVLPVNDGALPIERISPIYDLEQYLNADRFELHSFHGKERTVLLYEHGERREFSVVPDESAPEGILVQIEWKSPLTPEDVLTEKDVFHALLRMFPFDSSQARLGWEPAVWFNSKRIQ